MSGLATALELSAKIVRENLDCPATARRLINERMRVVSGQIHHLALEGERNRYLENMVAGFAAALHALYGVARRDGGNS